jgi:shikimate kinase
VTPVAVLVGPPGAGKSTVGGLLAQRLHVSLRDTDTDVEERAGSSVADIFVEQGEPVFRTLERDAVRSALAEHDGVLALGGGAVTDADIRALLRDHRVVFLDVTLADAARPLLLGNPRAQLHRLMTTRRPLYQEVATVTVDTADKTPQDVADAVAAALGEP